MAIHIQDEEVDWLVRDFARRRGVGITAAVKIAIKEASAKQDSLGEDLARKLEPVLEKIRAKRPFEAIDHKAVSDDGWGEPTF